MASLWEPPALLTLAVLLGGGAGAIYYALRPALKGPLPEVTSERDEVWGVDDPPPPAKKPYVYPDQRPVPVPAPVAPVTDHEPEPLAVMADGPTVAPLPAPMPARVEALEEAAAPSTSSERADVDHSFEDEDEDEEVSLADLFRPRRRPRSHAAPNDAPTQD